MAPARAANSRAIAAQTAPTASSAFCVPKRGISDEAGAQRARDAAQGVGAVELAQVPPDASQAFHPSRHADALAGGAVRVDAHRAGRPARRVDPDEERKAHPHEQRRRQEDRQHGEELRQHGDAEALRLQRLGERDLAVVERHEEPDGERGGGGDTELDSGEQGERTLEAVDQAPDGEAADGDPEQEAEQHEAEGVDARAEIEDEDARPEHLEGEAGRPHERRCDEQLAIAAGLPRKSVAEPASGPANGPRAARRRAAARAMAPSAAAKLSAAESSRLAWRPK